MVVVEEEDEDEDEDEEEVECMFLLSFMDLLSNTHEAIRAGDVE